MGRFLRNRDRVYRRNRRTLESYPVNRRAAHPHALNSIRVNHDRKRHFTRGHELREQRMAFAHLQVLPSEPSHKVDPLLFAQNLDEMIKPLILFGLQTDLAFPLRMQEIFVTARRVFESRPIWCCNQ